MGNHEFIHEAKKKAMAGMTVTVCGFALMMLQGNTTASASTDKPTTTGNQPTTEVQQGAAVVSNTATLQERVAVQPDSSSTQSNGNGISTGTVTNTNPAGSGDTSQDNGGTKPSDTNTNPDDKTNTGENKGNDNKSTTDKTKDDKIPKVNFDIHNDVTDSTGSLTGHTVNGNTVTIDGTHSATFKNTTKDTKIYQWVFLMDGSKELARQQVPDYTTKNIHVVFDLSGNTSNWKSDPLHVIFRYTTSPSGDLPFVDWTSPNFDFLAQTVDLSKEIRDNSGWIDNYDTFDKQDLGKDGLHVIGWNALRWNNPDHAKEIMGNGTMHHFIEVVDTKTNKVLSSVEVTKNVSRSDVPTHGYADYYQSDQSGFDVVVPLTNDSSWNTDPLTIRSVYTTATTDAQATNSNSTYYTWPTAFTRYAPSNIPQGQDLGSLDNVSYADGKLYVRGWNSILWPNNVGQNLNLHHYLIVYDRTTNQQLAVKEIKNTKRTDVDDPQNYPGIYGGDYTGFETEFDIDASKYPTWATDVLCVVSRYSTSATGNGDDGVASHKADWWSYNFTSNKGNFGWLDEHTLNGSKLSLRGWHATTNSFTEPYRYIIIFDKTHNKQLAVVPLTKDMIQQRTAPGDVASQYTGVYNSANSGFKLDLAVATDDWYNSDLQVVDRYSRYNVGNGDIGQGGYTDYWSPTFRLPRATVLNRAWFDYVNLADGHVNVKGWHLTNNNGTVNKQLLLLRDDNTGQIISTVDVSEDQPGYQNRPDLAKVDQYKDLTDVTKSGFLVSLANDNQLTFGHHYTIISRRCESIKDNGADGTYYDATTSFTYNQHNYWIDSINYGQNAPLRISGWMASDASMGTTLAGNAYVIVSSNGVELGRAKVDLYQHAGVTAQNPMIANGENSGFSVTFDGNNGLKYINAQQDQLNVVLRFTDTANGDASANSDDVANITYYNYNMTNNAVNHYILDNHIGHANINSHIVLHSGAYYYNDKSVPQRGAQPTIVIPQVADSSRSLSQEINFEQQNSGSVFYHTVIDANNIENIANTDEVAYGAGYPANGRAVQFTQINTNSASDFARELANAAYYTAYVMKQYNMQPSLAQSNGDGTIWTLRNVENWMGGVDTQHAPEDTVTYWTQKAQQFFGTNYTASDFLELVKYEMSQM